MIGDLGLTLRAILSKPGLPKELAAAQIVFDRPADPFNPTQMTVDLFLYDIRENRDMPAPARPSLPSGAALAVPPSRSLVCTYLVTAWPVGRQELALQEQQLLREVLQMLSGLSTIPAGFLQDSLAGHDPPPQMLVLHPDALKNTAEFWTSLGNKLRPSLSATVTIALLAFQVAVEAAGETALGRAGRSRRSSRR